MGDKNYENTSEEIFMCKSILDKVVRMDSRILG